MNIPSLNKVDQANWTWEKAKHLLNRAGFGGRRDEIDAFVQAGPEESVNKLFQFTERTWKQPDWLQDYITIDLRKVHRMDEERRKELMREGRKHMRQLQQEWVRWLYSSPTPADMLRDKMSFFWHGHFATSAQKVKLPPLIYQQVQFFYNNAAGSFRDLLHGISRDPAMLRYLDNHKNRKGKPNENFARELMELFSLGQGNYTEKDVKEAARAFTGWTNDPLSFKFRRRQHDFGKKIFLGHEGTLDGEDIVNIILQQPACAEFMTRKLLAYFAFDPVSEEVVAGLVSDFRNSDYDTSMLLSNIFLHPDFYHESVIGNQIKSPVQLVVGTARTLALEIENDELFSYALRMMGQVPYLPPNVKGWPGGRAWIDTSRLLTRFTFGEIVGSGEIPTEIAPARGRRRKPGKPKAGGDKMLRKMMRKGRLGIEFDPDLLLANGQTPDRALTDLEEVLLTPAMTAPEREVVLANYKKNLGKMSRHQALQMMVGDLMKRPGFQLC